MSNIHLVETGIGSSQEGHLSDSTTLCGRVPKFQAAGTGSAFMESHQAMLDWLVSTPSKIFVFNCENFSFHSTVQR